jgi:hypothetical protein
MNSNNIRAIALAAALAASTALGLSAVAAADDAPQCSSVDADQMCHFDASAPFSDITMVYPANYPDQQALVGYLDKVENDYTSFIGSQNLTQPTGLDVTSTRYTSGPPLSGTQSVVTKMFQNGGGAHPSIWYKSFNYNLATQQPITYDTLFQPGTQPLQTLWPIVQKSLNDQTGEDLQLPQDAGLNPDNYRSFAITNDDVIFFFDRDAFFGALGPQQVSVPRSAIAGLLSPDIA